MEAFLHGVEHWRVSYEALVPDLGSAGANWRAPLFRYMFNFRPGAEKMTVTPLAPPKASTAPAKKSDATAMLRNARA